VPGTVLISESVFLMGFAKFMQPRMHHCEPAQSGAMAPALLLVLLPVDLLLLRGGRCGCCMLS